MLYHSEVFFPEKLKSALPKGNLTLKYGRHAQQACNNDRYGRIIGPTSIDLSRGNVFEAEVREGKLVKIAVRMSYDDVNDISIVIGCDRDNYFVRTVWLNKKTDKHRTLDKNKYARG